MNRLLKFEFRKLIQGKAGYIFLGVQVISVFIIAVLAHLVGPDMAALIGVNASGVGIMMGSLSLGITSIALAIFVSLFVCGDRTDDVLKNIYARGYTATEVFFAELIAVVVYGAVYCIVSWLSGLIIGAALFGMAVAFTGKVVLLLFIQFIVVCGYIALFFMFSKVVLKTGGVIILNIMIPTVISLLFTILDLVLAIKATGVKTMDYILDGALKNTSDPNLSGNLITVSALMSLAYCALFTALGWLANRKRSA